MKSKKEKDLEFRERVEQMYLHRNSKYGEFIIQTNSVQFHLVWLIRRRTRSGLISKKLIKYLEGLTLGNLINYFRICAQDSTELSLADDLELYSNKRNKLAHKMYTENKLTITECVSSMRLGKNLLSKLEMLIKK